MLTKIFLILGVVVVLAVVYFLYSNYKKFGYQVEGSQVFFTELAPGGLEFQKSLIADADAQSFKILDGKYAYDKNRVYFVGRIIEGANPNTFQVIKVDESRVEAVYSKDDQSVFRFDRPLKGVDPATFEIVINGDEVTFKDKNQTYDRNGQPK